MIVFAMEIVLQTVEIAGTLPLTHGQVVKQIVATSLWFIEKTDIHELSNN